MDNNQVIQEAAAAVENNHEEAAAAENAVQGDEDIWDVLGELYWRDEGNPIPFNDPTIPDLLVHMDELEEVAEPDDGDGIGEDVEKSSATTSRLIPAIDIRHGDHRVCVTSAYIELKLRGNQPKKVLKVCMICYVQYADIASVSIHRHVEHHETGAYSGITTSRCYLCKSGLYIVRSTNVCALCTNII